MRILFVHIPKTGGTAVRSALFRGRPDAMNLCDYGPRSPTTSPLVRELRYAKRGGLPALCERLSGEPRLTLLGHVLLADYHPSLRADLVCTVLRDPVDRVVSHFAHARRHQGYGGSFEAFAEDPSYRNLQSRFLAGAPLTDLDLVGRQEELPRFARSLSERVATPLTLKLANVTAAADKEPVSAQLRRRVMALNADDADLYERLSGRPAPAAALKP